MKCLSTREANMTQLAALQQQYQAKQESIQDLERTLILIQDQLSNRRIIVQHSTGPVTDGEPKNSNELDSYQRLANLRSTLESLLLKYTEKHPEIIRIRKLIAKLEKEVEAGTATKNGSQKQSVVRQSVYYDKILMHLEVQQKNIQIEYCKY